MNVFISLKAIDEEVHINFVASDKGGNGLKIEDRIISLILVACNQLDIKCIHYDVENGEPSKQRAQVKYDMTPCPNFSCWHFHQTWTEQT